MQQVFNQYSYIIAGLGLLAALVIILRWRRRRWSTTLGAALLGVLIIGWVWSVVRPGGTGTADTLASAEATLNNGRPTFIEFYSQYCLGCVAVRGEVETLVSHLHDRYNILLVDIHSELGRALRQKLGFSYSPEFVLFDTRGQEVWRSNRPPSSIELAMAAP